MENKIVKFCVIALISFSLCSCLGGYSTCEEYQNDAKNAYFQMIVYEFDPIYDNYTLRGYNNSIEKKKIYYPSPNFNLNKYLTIGDSVSKCKDSLFVEIFKKDKIIKVYAICKSIDNQYYAAKEFPYPQKIKK